MQKNTLLLFTNEFPFGNGESFIVNELLQHSAHFEKIIVFPLIKKGEARSVPPNVQVISLFTGIARIRFSILLKHFFPFLIILSREFFASGAKTAFVKKSATLRSILLQNLYRADVLQEYLEQNKNHDNLYFYSFWTDDWATVLSILKRKGMVPSFISRVHGYDLYKERWPGGILPFRKFQLEQVSKVLAASKDGKEYLDKHYPEHKSKFYLSHLSIFDCGIGPFSDEDPFVIASCSNLIPLKRIHLIAEALSEVKFKTTWVHFGDGPERPRIEGLVKKLGENITVELRGSVRNAAIIEFYKSGTVNVFIHMSETEGGVPLSLQEAACCGIPLMGTTAGGAFEIINEETGIALGNAVSSSELGRMISEFKNSSKNTLAFRKRVRAYWFRNFGNDSYDELHNLITNEK